MKFEPETANDPVALSSSAADSIPFYLANLSEEEKMQLGHQLKDTVPLCDFNGVRCPQSDFKTFYDESLGRAGNPKKFVFKLWHPAGNCFTFNFPNPSLYNTARPGADSGLTVLLQSLFYDVYQKPDLLPFHS